MRELTLPDAVSGRDAPPSLAGGLGLTCPGCGRTNPHTRRFCSACGRALWSACPQCREEMPASEAFCGACGLSVDGFYRQQQEQYATQLEQARRQLAEHDYEAPQRTLLALAGLKDARYAAVADEARRLLEQLPPQQQQAETQAAAAYAEAQALFAQRTYDRAAVRLEAIPLALRSAAMLQLAERARACQAEVQLLESEIAAGVRTRRLVGRREQIERLLELQPHHLVAHQAAQQLRNSVVLAAQRRLGSHHYAEAVKLLEQVPAVAKTKEVQQLVAQAEELHWLLAAATSAAVVDTLTVAIAQRLRKLAPQNTLANELCARIQQRLRKGPEEATHVAPNWSPPLSEPLGLPVHWLAGCRRLKCSLSNDALLRQYPGRFFVALGLALHGLGVAHLPIDLLRPRKESRRFALPFQKKRPPACAWGLDVGQSALKVAKLVRAADSDVIQVETVELIEHNKCLTLAITAQERQAVIEATIAQLRQRVDLGDVPVVMSMPGQLVLSRTFRLPPVPSPQVEDALKLEARLQIPYPLEETCWGYHLVQVPGPAGTETPVWDVNLQAAKEYLVSEWLAPWKAANLVPHALQSDGLALHNFLAYEYLPPTGDDAPNVEFAVASLDVGVESSRIVVCMPTSTWFRAIPLGSEALGQRLVTAFRITWAQAEQLKRQPTLAKRMSPLYAAVEPDLQHLLDEVQRSLDFFGKQQPGVKIQQLLGTGGGFAFHGLLRFLRSGRVRESAGPNLLADATAATK